jgi:hypothetical protein
MLWLFGSILQPFGIFGSFYGCLLYFPHFGKLYHEKSGNPAAYLLLENEQPEKF